MPFLAVTSLINREIVDEMRFLIGILCLIAFAAAETLTLRESREVLQYHNKIRSKVRPTAANMMKLVRNANSFSE